MSCRGNVCLFGEHVYDWWSYPYSTFLYLMVAGQATECDLLIYWDVTWNHGGYSGYCMHLYSKPVSSPFFIKKTHSMIFQGTIHQPYKFMHDGNCDKKILMWIIQKHRHAISYDREINVELSRGPTWVTVLVKQPWKIWVNRQFLNHREII